ncbi:hypothetical protein KJ765_04485 [Candidatus Micrarchaeota archaeon]|nr:hypothetical protein [Candidatus Micrarchaeota archaeon]
MPFRDAPIPERHDWRRHPLQAHESNMNGFHLHVDDPHQILEKIKRLEGQPRELTEWVKEAKRESHMIELAEGPTPVPHDIPSHIRKEIENPRHTIALFPEPVPGSERRVIPMESLRTNRILRHSAFQAEPPLSENEYILDSGRPPYVLTQVYGQFVEEPEYRKERWRLADPDSLRDPNWRENRVDIWRPMTAAERRSFITHFRESLRRHPHAGFNDLRNPLKRFNALLKAHKIRE